MFRKNLFSGGLLLFCFLLSKPVMAYDVAQAEFTHDSLTNDISNYPTLSTEYEEYAEVYYPIKENGDIIDGMLPLIIILHGQHQVCYDKDDVNGAAVFTWPCPPDFESVPNYKGYKYLGEALAEQGFIVASINSNGVAAIAGTGIVTRGEFIEYHLDLWNMFNTSGGGANFPIEPFQSKFMGKVDMSSIGTIGHSRGGDGVVQHYNYYASSSPYTVKAVFVIAPTNYNNYGHIQDVPFAALIPYCDGDVYGLSGLEIFDNSRYYSPTDQTSKYTLLSMGANHNYFNTVWTPECWNTQQSPDECWEEDFGYMPIGGSTFPDTKDDWITKDPSLVDSQCGTLSSTPESRLTPVQQRDFARTYITAFFEYFIAKKKLYNGIDSAALLRGDVTYDDASYSGYHPPANQRLDLNRLRTDDELLYTTLANSSDIHGQVSQNFTGLDDVYDRCTLDCFRDGRAVGPRVPHTGLSRLRIGWSGTTGSYVNELPIGTRNIGSYGTLQLRASIDYLGVSTSSPVEFSVTLSNGSSSVTVSTDDQLGNNALFVPPGDDNAKTSVMNTVRIPLDLFGDETFLEDIQEVELAFDSDTPGTILLADIAFTVEECHPDLVSPIIEDAPDQVVTGCDVFNGGEIQLNNVPTAEDDCAEDVLVTGEVIASDSGAEGTGVIDGTIVLPPGTHTIRWTADDGRNTAFVDQVITVIPGLFASKRLVVGNGADVTGIVSAGSEDTLIGNEASTKDIVSIADVEVGHYADVDGSIVSAGSIVKGSGGSLSGDTYPYQTDLVLPDLPSLEEVVFPPPTGDLYEYINPVDPVQFAPGSYHNLYVNSGGILVLEPGDYYFKTLVIQSQSTVEVIPSGLVRIFVQNKLELRSIFVDGSKEPIAPYIGFVGTNQVVLEAPWLGTVIAPNATMEMGAGSATDFTGEYMAETLVIRPYITVTCFSFGSMESGDPSCDDGIRNQNETDVDCGGVCNDTCEEGEMCIINDDCTSHHCVSGYCESSGGGCTEAIAIDLGSPGNETTVPNDGCVMVRDNYPSWWGTRTMLFQNMSPGSYPVPFAWSNACTGSSGSNVFTGDWQSQYLSMTDDDCATLFDLQGSGSGTIRLRYYGG